MMADMANNLYSGDQNSIQHTEFVRNYVADIALTLEELGRNKGYSLPTQFYQDLAWGGLTEDKNKIETTWFKNAIPSQVDRTRIKNIIKIEQSGYDTNGNSKMQNGSHSGC